MSDEEEIYCICRSTDVTRFMIACDHCEEWYHGDCINITEEDASIIKRFYCDKCKKKNPSLEIKYKTKKINAFLESKGKLPKDKIKSKDPSESKHTDHNIKEEKHKHKKDKHKEEKSKSDKHTEKKTENVKEDKNKKQHKDPKQKEESSKENKHKSKHKKDKHKEKSEKDSNKNEKTKLNVVEKSTPSKPIPKLSDISKSTSLNVADVKSIISSSLESPQKKSLGTTPLKNPIAGLVEGGKSKCSCDACKLTSDCGKCEPCQYSRSGAGVDTTCLRRRCHKMFGSDSDLRTQTQSKSTSEMDWQSSETSKLSSTNSKGSSASNKGSSASTKVSSASKGSSSSNKVSSSSNKVSTSTSQKTSVQKAVVAKSNTIYSSDESEERARPVLKDKNDETYSDDDVWEPKKKVEKIEKKKPKEKATKAPTKKSQKKSVTSKSSSKKRKGHPDSDASESENESGPFGPKFQCQGPSCVNPSRPHSKYCSQTCGQRLAEKRIFAILPQRIQEWKLSGCVAETNDSTKLDKIRKQQIQLEAELEKLDLKAKELDKIIERGIQLTIDPQVEEGGEDDTGGEGPGVYCVTCGHEVATRRAIKHMETCFNKLECQTSFGSHFKTRIENGTMFCDFFMPNTRTYCKRLRVMCPEHYKEPKVPDTRVCGAPLVKDVFTETGELCRASRKRCVKHYRWERLRRAEIDMERVRQWMKNDELHEQERQARQTMTNRAGVLGLMLHSAYDHALATRFEEQLKMQREQRKVSDKSGEDSPPKRVPVSQSDSSKGAMTPKTGIAGQKQKHIITSQSKPNIQSVYKLTTPHQLQPSGVILKHQLTQQPSNQKQQSSNQQQQSNNQHVVMQSNQRLQSANHQPQFSQSKANQQSSINQPRIVSSHVDHQYLKSQNETRKDTKIIIKPQKSDHQYYRLSSNQDVPGPIKLKVPQKSGGGIPQKTVIQLQKGSGVAYVQNSPRMVSQPFAGGSGTQQRFYPQKQASSTRFHQDHQYSHGTNPQVTAVVQRGSRPAHPNHSDHMYFTSKKPTD